MAVVTRLSSGCHGYHHAAVASGKCACAVYDPNTTAAGGFAAEWVSPRLQDIFCVMKSDRSKPGPPTHKRVTISPNHGAKRASLSLPMNVLVAMGGFDKWAGKSFGGGFENHFWVLQIHIGA